MTTENKAKAPVVHVAQVFNQKFAGAHNTPDEDMYRYKVTKTLNTLEVTVREEITKERVQGLIDAGVAVTVT